MRQTQPTSTPAETPTIVRLTAGAGDEAMDEFGTETEVLQAEPPPRSPSSPALAVPPIGLRPAVAPLPIPAPAAVAAAPASDSTGTWRRWPLAAVAVVLAGLAPIPLSALWGRPSADAAPSRVATIVVESEPSGVEVYVDGNPAGYTPTRTLVPAGTRTLDLRYQGRQRSVSLSVAPGELVRQRVEFVQDAPVAVVAQAPPPPAPKPAPPAPRVPQGALSGSVRMDVGAVLRIFESGRFLGTTEVDRLMLPVGEHALEFRSEELGFSTQQTVEVEAGETTIVAVRLPSAPMLINAKPWAEAWVDGERVGETPIGTLQRPIGRHEVVLRHPELGERRQSVLLTLNQPVRVSVDFERPAAAK